MDKPFWISVDIHKGSNEDTVAELKALMFILRKDFLKDSQDVFGQELGTTKETIKKYENLPGKPLVGFSLIKKICKAYGLKCELKIYRE